MDRQILAELKTKLMEENASCVVQRGEITSVSMEKGIRPLIDWLEKDTDFFRGAFVADKVIGKAAALLLVYGGVKSVYAGVLSEPAEQVLAQYRVEVLYGERVDRIVNRAGDGLCPMELRSLSITEPEQAYLVFRELVMGNVKK